MYLLTVNKDLTSYNIFAAQALKPMTAPGCVTDYLHATIDNMHVACPSSPPTWLPWCHLMTVLETKSYRSICTVNFKLNSTWLRSFPWC